MNEDMERAALSAATTIIDNWDTWSAYAEHAATTSQDAEDGRCVLVSHIADCLRREFGRANEA